MNNYNKYLYTIRSIYFVIVLRNKDELNLPNGIICRKVWDQDNNGTTQREHGKCSLQISTDGNKKFDNTGR